MTQCQPSPDRVIQPPSLSHDEKLSTYFTLVMVGKEKEAPD